MLHYTYKITVINLARICAVLPNKALGTLHLKASISSFAQLKRGDKQWRNAGQCAAPSEEHKNCIK